MQTQARTHTGVIAETMLGIVDRVPDAVKNQDTSQRQTYLKELLQSESVSY